MARQPRRVADNFGAAGGRRRRSASACALLLLMWAGAQPAMAQTIEQEGDRIPGLPGALDRRQFPA
ncbi:MAG: hypothetical protein M5U16_15325 [Hyphomicrobium sp.]|nr:hypothetical protein [Hyphomicrobium sp.]